VQFSGWDRNDLAAYAAAAGRPVPALDQIAVDGANVHRSDGAGGETEVALDQEALLAVAPAARHRVYIAPNSFQGMYHAYDQLADDVRSAGITAVSISWGSCESSMSAGARVALDGALDRIVAAGATVFAASGDSGALCQTGPSSAIRDVSHPASSPAVVGVGGTALYGSGTHWNETGWSNEYGAGGGGTSKAYDKPDWQTGVGVSGTKRLVPDVAAVADPTTGPGIYLGTEHGFVFGGGTSVASPLVAGQFVAALTARGCAAGVGDVHAALYANPGAFRDVTSGSNGTWKAAAGYDRATGLGTPRWSALGALLPSTPTCPAPSGPASAGATATSVTSSSVAVPAGTSIHSPNGQFWLDLQQNGNLVEWGNGRALWSTGTAGAGNTMSLGANGVLTVRSASGAVEWTSKAATSSGSAKLTVTDTGDVRVTAGSGKGHRGQAAARGPGRRAAPRGDRQPYGDEGHQRRWRIGAADGLERQRGAVGPVRQRRVVDEDVALRWVGRHPAHADGR
jgi:subtilase family serine protease